MAVMLYFKQSTRFYSALIFLFFAFNGFQILTYDFLYSFLFFSKSYDYAIIIVTLIFLIEIDRNTQIIKHNKISKFILVFILFVIANIIYSIIVKEYAIVDVIRASRHFLLFLSFFYFSKFNRKELVKLFKLLIYITIFVSILYILQYPLSTVLYGGDDVTTTLFKAGGITWIRYYNIPILLTTAIFYLLFIRKNFYLLIILFTAALLPLHRTLIISIFITILLITTKSNYRFFSYVIIFIVALVISQIDLFSTRLTLGFQDVSDVYSKGTEIAGNTLGFRFAHFLERLNYIINHKNWFFGLGFITEDSAFSNVLHFKIGLLNEKGGVVQVDTGDFSWSLLIVKLGIVGTLLFVFVYVQFFIQSLKYNSNCRILLWSVLLISFLLSFSSTILFNHTTYVIIVFLYILVLKTNKTPNELSINYNNYTLI